MADTAPPLMDLRAFPWWNAEVFRAHGRAYTWHDVLMSARLRGDWEAIDRAAREGVSCAAEAMVSGTGPEKARLDEAAREFRYTEDLITAASAERWLERWGLSVEQWHGHFTRVMLRRDWSGRVAELLARHPPGQQAVAAAAIVDAICAGHLRQLARELAERVVVPRAPTGVTSSTSDAAGLVEATVRAARADGWPDLAPERLEELAEAERHYRAFRSDAISPSSLAEHVGSRQLDWTRFECRALGFAGSDGANEAVLCLREDGLPLEELARQSNSAVRETSFFLEELDAAVHDRFVGASPGDIVGPLRQNGEFLLYEVVGKTLPSPSDPIVRIRAQEGLLKRAIAHQVANHVQWSAER